MQVQDLHHRIEQARAGHSGRQQASQSNEPSGPTSHGSNQRHHASRDAGGHATSSGPAGMGGSRRQGASESTAARKRHESKPAVDENAVCVLEAFSSHL